ncbi:MAG: hypothetical protein F6K03_11125, partial [Kamptonema sp. SIO4C4]|nr:hypothetical protein [Kamptonema sp. SIO4C4]
SQQSGVAVRLAMETNRTILGVENDVNQEVKRFMCSLRDCESQPHRSRSVSAGETASTHPLSSPTCFEVGESHGYFVEREAIIFSQPSSVNDYRT